LAKLAGGHRADSNAHRAFHPMNGEDLFYFFLGWLIGWLIKYVVFGLGAWDRIFHPERYTADTTGPYKLFAQPFLGIFSHA
jgi:hypothetical protein